MKFIHLSDICIGNSSESGMRWEGERQRELVESLKVLMARAEEERVELIMITGGLFSHVPVSEELKEAADIFMAHGGIEIVITAGLSDAVSLSSPVKSMQWPENVHYVSEEGVNRIVLEKLHTEIYAASVVRMPVLMEPENEEEKGPEILPFREMTEEEKHMRAGAEYTEKISVPDPEAFIKAAASDEDREAIRIAMITFADRSELDAFKLSDFSYVAAGGPGSGEGCEVIKDLLYMPGSFEPQDPADTGSHGAMSGEISLNTGRLERIDFVPMASTSYVTLNIRVNNKTTEKELCDSLRTELEKRRAKNIYRLRVTGKRDPELKLNFESVRRDFRIREIVDETEPWYDFAELFREHPQDMIGFYISTIINDRKEMSDMEKRAMFYGIDALIDTADDKESL